jgi:hypothetical protein
MPTKNAGAGTAAPGGGGTATASAGMYCDFLSTMLPLVKDPKFLKDANEASAGIGGAPLTLADAFIINYLAWGLGHKTGPGALDAPTASQLDDETKTKCADKRAEALAILGSPSFEAASQG